MATVVDYSWTRPSPAAIAGAGYIGAMRYLSHEPAKDLSPAERDGLWAAGVAVGLVWETTANAPLGGYPKGVEHARAANRQADALGWPADRVLVYAVDFNPTVIDSGARRAGVELTATALARRQAPTPAAQRAVDAAFKAQLPTVADYFRGVNSVPGRPVGVYGTYSVIENIVGSGLAGWGWQCAAWSGRAPAGTPADRRIHVPAYGYSVRLSPLTCLFQYYGSLLLPNTDHNVVTPCVAGHADALLFHPAGAPVPAPIEEDYDMKAVFCPDPGHTGGVGWLAMIVDGIRYREGYTNELDLDVDRETGAVDGVIELHGERAQRFLERYRVLPDFGAFIARPRADSAWATEAGLAAGDRPRIVFHPSGIAVRIHDDWQAQVDAYVGVPDKGEIDDAFLWNMTLQPWVASVSASVIVQAISEALADVTSPALPAGFAEDVAARVDAKLAARLAQ